MARHATYAVDDSPRVTIAPDIGSPQHVYIRNSGPDVVYVGDGSGTVTDANGWPIASGGLENFQLNPDESLDAVCAAGDTATVHVLRTGTSV